MAASVCTQLQWLLNPSRTAAENLETVKDYFSNKLNAFYLLELESRLQFDPGNVVDFFLQIGGLGKVYFHVFHETPAPSLKVQWVMQALCNDQAANKDIIERIQAQWGAINRDPLLLRRVLFQYLHLCRGGKLPDF